MYEEVAALVKSMVPEKLNKKSIYKKQLKYYVELFQKYNT